MTTKTTEPKSKGGVAVRFFAAFEDNKVGVGLGLPAVLVVGYGVLAVYWCEWDWSILVSLRPEGRALSYSTVASVAGALLGFCVTAVALLASILRNQSFNNIEDLKEPLLAVFFRTIAWLSSLTAACLLGIYLEEDSTRLFAVELAVLWLVLVCALHLAYCVWLVKRISYRAVRLKGSNSRAKKTPPDEPKHSDDTSYF